MFTAGIPKMSEMAMKNLQANRQELKAKYGKDSVVDPAMVEYLRRAN